MGLHRRVNLTLVIIALTQIACRHCMPRIPGKATLKRYLNDLNPVKSHPVPTPYSTSRANPTLKQTFGKKAQNGKISQNTFSKESLYKTYNFPENEYPLDNSPRDPFRTSMNFNHNNHVGTLQKTHNVQSTTINDLKKEMKIKRKLLSNKQINMENSQLKSDLPTIKLASYPDSIRLLDSESFPDVQYPLNSMDTWGSNYWNYVPFTQEKQFNVFEQQVLNFKSKEEASKPLTKLTKSKARQYLELYDKLKEEQRRTSTENSKRSNVGQKGLNFTKTATCESVSDDFMTAGLVSNIPSNSTETKNKFVPTTEISSENVCPFSEYLNNSVPIPYRVIENENEKLCPTFKLKNNTKELLDLDTSVLAQTLHLIEEILLFDETSLVVSTGNYSKAIESNVDSSHCTDFSVNEDKPTMLNDSAKSCTDCSSAEKLSQEVPDDTSAVVLQYQTPLLQDEKILQNITKVSGPLNVEMPLPFTEPIRNETCPYVTSSGQSFVAMPKSQAVPGTTSIIIIPIDNNSIGKLQSQTIETTSGKQIILYLPFTQNSGIPSQTHNQIVSSSLDNSVPNNEQNNVIFKMAPIQNDNSSTALVSELLNSVSDSGSSLLMYDTLPTNSMCYNNESSPSSMKEKPISDIPIHESMTDDAPLITTIYDEQLSQQSIESGNFGLNTATLPQNTNFAHPLFDFAGGEFTSLSLGPYNNVLINELPILAREINSEQQFSDVSSKDLFIPTENVISKDNNIYYNALPSIKNGAPTAGDQSSSTGIITDEIPPTPLIDTTVKQPVPLKTSLTSLSEFFSDTLPDRVDMQLPPKPSAIMDTSSLPPINNNSPMMPDMSVKMELYKIRHILDKMLSSETLTDSLTTPAEQISSPISNADSIPNHMHKSLEPCQTLADRDSLPTVDKTVLPPSESDTPLNQIENLQPQKHEPLRYGQVDGTPSEFFSLPGDNSSIPSLFLDTTDSPLILIDVTNPPAIIFETDTDYKPYLIDNIVTPLSETRTDLSRTIEDVPSKISVVIPNTIKVPSDDVPTAVSNLPIMVPQEHAHINNKSNNSSMQVVETQKHLSEDLVSDLLYDTNTLPTAKVMEAGLPDILSESHTTATNCYTDKTQHNISPSLVPKTEGDKKQKNDSTLSANRDVYLSDLPIDQPSLSNNSTSPINDNVSEVSYSYSDTKNLQLVLNSLLSPKDDSRPDIMVTDILKPMSPSLKNNLQSDNQDKTSNETQSEYTLSDIPFHDLTISEEKLLPLLEAKEMLQENKIFPKIKDSTNLPTSEKVEDTFALPVNKTHLATSVLGIPENLSLKIDEACTDEPDILTDDTETQNKTEALSHTILHNASVNVLLPTNKVSLQLNTLDNTSLSHKSIPLASKLPITRALLENILSGLSTKDFSLPVSKDLPVKSFSELNKTVYHLESTHSDFTEDNPLPSVNEIIYNAKLDDDPKDNVLPIPGKSEYTLPLRENKTISDVSSSNNLSDIKFLIDKEVPFSNIDLTTPKPEGLPKDTLNDLPVPNTESHSSSKLLTTKVLLENVLSEINQNRFSLPVKKNLSVNHTTSHSELDKTLYSKESILSDMIEQSSQEEVPYSAINEDVFELCLEKIFPDNPKFDMHADDYPTEQTTKKQLYNLIEQIGDEESKTSFSEKSVDDAGIVPTFIDKALPHSKIDVMSLKPKNLPKDTPNNLPLPRNKPLSSSKLPITKALSSLFLDTTDSPILLIDVTNPPATNFETDTDYKPYLIDNQVTSLSETRTDLSRTIEHVPSKIGVVIPNIIEVPSDDVPTAVSNLTIVVPQKHANINNKSNNSSMQVVETQKPLSEDLVSTFPTAKVMEAGLPDILSESRTTATNCYTDKTQHNISPSPVPMTEGNKKQKNYSTLFANQDVYLSDLPVDQPSLSINSTSPINDNVSEVSYSYSNTKDLLLVLDSLLSPKNDSRPDITVTDILTPVSPSLKNNLQSDNQDKTSNETQSEYTLPDIPFHDLTLSEEKLLPLLEAKEMLQENKIFPNIKDSANLPTSEKVVDTFPLPVNKTHLVASVLGIPENLSLKIDEACTDEPDILTDDTETQNKTEALSHIILHDASVDDLLPTNKVSLQLNTLDNSALSHKSILSASKLPITRALLENILSGLSTKDFSLPVSKDLPVKSFSELNKTVYNLESTHSDFTEDNPLPSVNEIIYNAKLDDDPKDNVLPISGKSEYTLPLREDKTISDVSNSNNLSEIKSLIDKELPFSNVDLTTPKPEGLPKDTLNDLPVPNTKSLSSSKLLITKVLLENVLSEINQNRFSLPVKKNLSVDHTTSRSELDKILYFIGSTLSDMIEQSSQEEVPYSAINKDVFELCLEKIFPDNPNFYIPADDYPTEQTTKKKSYNLIEQIGDEESKTSFSEKSVDDAGAVPTLIDKALPHSKIDVMSLKPKNLPKDTPNNLPLPRNKPLSSSKLPITKALPSLFLDTTDSPLLLIDVTNPPATNFETDTDYKPYLIDNQVTSLSETRTDLSRTIEDVPSKNGVVIPNIIEVPSDDVPTAVSNLPIIVPQEHAHINNKSNNSSMEVVETQKPLSEDLVSDLLYDTNTLPTAKVMEARLPNILSESHTTATNCYTDKTQHNISPSLVPMTEGDKKQKNDSTLSANLSDLPIAKLQIYPSLSNNSTSPINDNVSEVSYSYSDTKNLLLVLNSLLSPKDDSRPDIMVTNILTPVSPSLKTNLQSDNQDKTSNETQSEYILPDIPFHDLTLSEEKLLPLLEAKEMLQENKIFPKIKDSANLPTSEKVVDTFPLPVNKTHLVASVLGIPENLSLKIGEACTDEPDILTDDIETQNKTEALSHIILHNASVDVLLPTNKVSLQLNTLDNTSLSHKSIPSASKLPITKALLENVLSDLSTKGFSLPVSKVLPVKSLSVLNKTIYNLESTHSDFTEDSPLPSVNEIIYNATLGDHPKDIVLPISGKSEYTLPLREDKTISDVSNSNNLSEIKSLIDKELPFSNVDLTTPKPEGLPKDTLNDLPVPNTESLSSSKLLITKVLLENVLSEINQNWFSLPEKKSLSIYHTTSRSELDKTLYFIESTLSDMIEQSSQEEVPYSAINKDVFELCLEKIFPDNPNFDISVDDYPTEQTTKKQSYNLIEQIGDEESKTTFSEKSVDDAGAVPTLIHKALPHSNIDVISLKPKSLPKDTPNNLPLPRNKPLSSSKLPITKALLENVLSEIKRKGFSLPVAQSLPVESPSD